MIYSPTSGVFGPINKMKFFKNLREQDGASIVNPIAVAVIIVTDDRVYKTVMSPSSSTWMKGREPLPAWIIESAQGMESAEKLSYRINAKLG